MLACLLACMQGAGKSTLAAALARARNCVHLSVARAVALSLQAARRDRPATPPPEDQPKPAEEQEEDEEREEEQQEDEDEDGEDSEPADDPDAAFVPPAASAQALQALELARQGQAVPADLALALLDEIMALDAVRFHGYVLDAVPGELPPERMAAWPRPPALAVVLQADPAAILNRWQGACVDPATGRVYTVADLAMSAPAPRDDADAEADEDEVDAPGDEDEPAERDPDPLPEPQLPAPPAVADAVRARLVALPPEHLAQLRARLDGYDAALALACFPDHARICVTALQPAHGLAASVLSWAHAAHLQPRMEPVVLDPPETLEFDSDEALRDTMQRANLEEDDEPAWQTSAFNVYCPVALVDDGVLRKGSAEFGVAYLGAFYICSSEAARDSFRRNPDRYLASSPAAPSRLIVLGPSASVASLGSGLSRETGAVLLDSDRLARSYLAEQQPGAAADPQAVISFRLGADADAPPDPAPALPADVYLEAIARAVASTGRSDWILTGFPRNVDEFTQLLDKGIVPAATVFVLRQPTDAPEPPVAEISDAARAKALPTIDVVLPEAEQLAPDRTHVRFTVAAGVQKVVDSVQRPLRAPAQESAHEVDEDEQDPNYGCTRHFCPVALARDRVLRPGNPDLAVAHNGMYFHLATEDNRTEFVAAPNHFVGTDAMPPALPPLRLLLAGPAGAGRLTHGRLLAAQHQLHFVSFAELVGQVAQTTGHPHQAAAADPDSVRKERRKRKEEERMRPAVSSSFPT